MEGSIDDRYAGDDAWREWFEVCAVERCGRTSAERLRPQISSAMYSRLARYGIGREETHGEDPVAFFDAYFKLKGSREKDKPLKRYFAYRVKTEGLRLRDFVCGTLFGAFSGRIHDIVVDWVAALKGWKPHTLRDGDGRRRVVWEGAGEDDVASLERAGAAEEADFLDVAPVREEIEKALASTAAKIKVEKWKVALLLYATAQDVSLTEAAVLEGLGTGKSRAYALREKTVSRMRQELGSAEGVGSPLFGRILLEVCEEAIPGEVRAKMGVAQ